MAASLDKMPSLQDPTVMYTGARSHGTNYVRPKLDELKPYQEDVRGMYLVNGMLEGYDSPRMLSGTSADSGTASYDTIDLAVSLTVTALLIIIHHISIVSPAGAGAS